MIDQWPLVLLGCLAVMAASGWVSRPLAGIWRWSFRLLVLITLLAMVAPPGLIDSVRALLDLVLPAHRSVSSGENAAFAVHFALFTLISMLLFWHRRDLPGPHLLAALLTLGMLTEGLQYLIDGRYASWRDVGTNGLGVVIGALLATALRSTSQNPR